MPRRSRRSSTVSSAVRQRAVDKFKVDSTPTFFINGQVQKGAMSFEEMQKLIDPLLKA